MLDVIHVIHAGCNSSSYDEPTLSSLHLKSEYPFDYLFCVNCRLSVLKSDKMFILCKESRVDDQLIY